ncbi:hypothetical protein FHS56_002031 [Thermonema lapsum]|uniref:Uncharacterized protein n=1 Tax=Thermonema lapsum TaxID=28195 RepID=A0A846MSD8_9BACT|nr:hypothetical protein [Thermonema lapsum]NIK74506.1 hypothetical protein [Thermonema lapsum]
MLLAFVALGQYATNEVFGMGGGGTQALQVGCILCQRRRIKIVPELVHLFVLCLTAGT